ncbi:histidine phosphatase family protein [Candidatus Woesearchaeota archaeon]|jgi:broad specificity phosphatase PhoE|nr:histidine phosphatase family protein [Candidatus Woesearchaeota archaeon]MBT4367973.1 histidine phosphatase family protein [Candidatus Woesearchaeota archaeon]MBT4712461.1 histidine phosphatase family protein [Candidatus Woesearchaeota archaeon]MBT6639374.1 histidine phosphatase family protein [Candidatus Woesearchaeota archaeon]MBT7133546.1 histidine phosphatase family protein [Candidatus Woesearchaeota archaeon]
MKVILVRHGETEENKKGIMQGHIPGKLSKLGIEQAKRLAFKLKDEKIDYIYSSDLDRAKDTAKEIAKFHTKVKIELVKSLREKFLGSWQGKTQKELGFSNNKVIPCPKDAETTEAMFNRAKNFLDKLLETHKNKTVLLVGHGGINKALTAAITNKTSNEVKTIDNFHNTSLSIFELDENKNHKINLFNCIKHLD